MTIIQKRILELTVSHLVIYSAKIPAGFNKENDEIKLSFEGSGSIDGSDGIVQSDVSKLTTATEIVKLITVKAVK